MNELSCGEYDGVVYSFSCLVLSIRWSTNHKPNKWTRVQPQTNTNVLVNIAPWSLDNVSSNHLTRANLLAFRTGFILLWNCIWSSQNQREMELLANSTGAARILTLEGLP
jgi:hypothetical protein